jgi:hypothetical protein
MLLLIEGYTNISIILLESVIVESVIRFIEDTILLK